MANCSFCNAPMQRFKSDHELYCTVCKVRPIPMDYITSIGFVMGQEIKVQILIVLLRRGKVGFSELARITKSKSAKLNFHLRYMRENDIVLNGEAGGLYRLGEGGKFIAELIDKMWTDYYPEVCEVD